MQSSSNQEATAQGLVEETPIEIAEEESEGDEDHEQA